MRACLKWCRSYCFVALLLLAGGMHAAEGAAFTSKPVVVKRDAGGCVISFAVAAPTDAAADILDAGGRIVRHLGAASLGARNDPPPPFTPGLTQSLTWDGRNDAGKPAAGGPFKFRVRLGLKADFGCFIGWEGTPPLAEVNGIAVGPDRSVYLINIPCSPFDFGRAETRIWVLSKDGTYKRSVYPYPATMDPKKLPGVELLSDELNRIKPRIYDRACPSYLPQMRALFRQTMAATSDGRLVMSSSYATELYRFGPRCLLVMNNDGSIPRARFDGPSIVDGVNGGTIHLALAPDDKSAYVCGLTTGEYGKPRNVIYRVGLGIGEKSEAIFGKMGASALGKDGLNEPRGIATDREGRVYVSDFGNNRVAVLDPKGLFLGEIPVKGPGVIAVHRKTGAIYVISTPGGPTYKLVKIAGFSDPKMVAELDLTKYGGIADPAHVNYHPVMALDAYGDVPVLYLGSPQTVGCRYRLMRIEDAGGKLKDTVMDIKPAGKIRGFPYPQGVDGDGNFFFLELASTEPSSDLLQGWEVKAGTGELKPWNSPNQGYRCEIGKDNYIYKGLWYTGISSTETKTFGLIRTDQNDKVVPFSATGAESEHYLGKGWRFAFIRGNLCIRPDGNIWALWGSAFEPSINMRVASLGPDGKVKSRELVRGLTSSSSLRVDSRGNIYVSDGLNLDGKPYPPEIDELVKKLRAKGTIARGSHSEAPEESYGEGYGSILKFGPDGGRIAAGAKAGPGETLLSSYPGKNKFVASGLAGAYPRISPMCPPRGAEFSACWCLHALFDIDGYDRLFVPDAMQFKVRVLDASFNEIAAFGDYDSATSKGGKDNLPGPPIPWEFPTQVNAAGDFAYVTDSASCARRIVRVKLLYAAEASCAL